MVAIQNSLRTPEVMYCKKFAKNCGCFYGMVKNINFQKIDQFLFFKSSVKKLQLILKKHYLNIQPSLSDRRPKKLKWCFSKKIKKM
jgi:hypothetical protein